MAIAAKDVMTLRKDTGLGMMEAKAALQETQGDMDKAKDLLRQKGLAKMDKRTDRESVEGKLAAVVSDDGSRGALVQVNTETDFTANNEQFIAMVQKIAQVAVDQNAGEVQCTDQMQSAIDEVRLTTKENIQFSHGVVFGSGQSKVGTYVHHTGKIGVLVEAEGPADPTLLKNLCMHISAMNPLGLTEDQVPEDVVQKERQVAKSQAMEQGKPEHIAEKMVEGKARKFLDQVVLLRQPYVLDDKQQVKDVLPNGVSIKQYARYQIGG